MGAKRGNLRAQLEVLRKHVVVTAGAALPRAVAPPPHVKDELVVELMMAFIQHTGMNFCANDHFQKAMRLIEADGEFTKTRVNAAREHMVEVTTKHIAEVLSEMKCMSLFADGWRRKFEEIFASTGSCTESWTRDMAARHRKSGGTRAGSESATEALDISRLKSFFSRPMFERANLSRSSMKIVLC
jgi:hypothetical protein